MASAPAVAPSSAPPSAAPSSEPGADRRAELRDRVAVSIMLLPFVFLVVETGGWLYLLALLAMLLVAAQEFAALFVAVHHRPATLIIMAGTALLVIAEQYPALNPDRFLPVLCLLVAVVWHLADYELGAPASGTDFAITLGGLFYLGVLGRYFVALRQAPNGQWWLLTVLGSVFLADTGAYVVGRLFGRRIIHRPLAPRLSPKKTWEGLAGSILVGGLGAALLAACWRLAAGPASLISWQTGAVLGALVGSFGQVGDLAISMLKRQAGVKDTGTIMAGHGGALDRIDSWLVVMAVGYYFVHFLTLYYHP